MATDRLTEAEPLILQALAIWEDSLGPNHPNTAASLGWLAEIYIAKNLLGEAEPIMRRALGIFVEFTRSTGHEHPQWWDAVNCYGSLLMKIGDRLEAVLSLMKSCGMVRAS